MRDHGLKLYQDSRKDFFSVRVVMHWNSLPRKVVESPFLEKFKKKEEAALRDIV